MAAANPLIVELLAQTDDHKIVATIDVVLKKLEEDGLAYRLSIPPKLVGVHPCNRDGHGISATEVHSLGSDIVGMGWSWKACAQAVCIEDDPQSTIATYTAHMVSVSNGGLGRADQLQVQFGSLACGHTNRFLCAVLDAVPCELENLSVDNRMSSSKIVANDPGLQDALTNGLKWLILKAIVGVLYPTLPDLVQRAMQATGLAQRAENEVQLLQRIQGAAKTMLARDKTVDWPTIASTVGKGRPESVDVEALIRYVQKWGGLPHGAFIADLNAFHKVYVPAGRIIPSSTFGALADLRLGPDELCPLFACAVLKAQATCPHKAVESRVCRFIKAAEITTLQSSSKKKTVVEAEKVLAMGRELAKQATIEDAVSTKLLGKLDTMMARFVMGKPMTVECKSTSDVGHAFFTLLKDASTAELKNPWQPTVAPKPQPAARAADPPQMASALEYDEAGKPKGAPRAVLQGNGFFEGVHVRTSKGQISTIKEAPDRPLFSVSACLGVE